MRAVEVSLAWVLDGTGQRRSLLSEGHGHNGPVLFKGEAVSFKDVYVACMSPFYFHDGITSQCFELEGWTFCLDRITILSRTYFGNFGQILIEFGGEVQFSVTNSILEYGMPGVTFSLYNSNF